MFVSGRNAFIVFVLIMFIRGMTVDNEGLDGYASCAERESAFRLHMCVDVYIVVI